MTMQRFRTIAGYFLMFLALFLMVVGYRWRRELKAGVVVKEAVVKVEAPKTEPVDDNMQTTGPVKIEFRYFIPDPRHDCNKHPQQCNATGEYQVRDTESRVWVLKFCDPVPDLKDHGTYDIKYIKSMGNRDCTSFVNAKAIQE